MFVSYRQHYETSHHLLLCYVGKQKSRSPAWIHFCFGVYGIETNRHKPSNVKSEAGGLSTSSVRQATFFVGPKTSPHTIVAAMAFNQKPPKNGYLFLKWLGSMLGIWNESDTMMCAPSANPPILQVLARCTIDLFFCPEHLLHRLLTSHPSAVVSMRDRQV